MGLGTQISSDTLHSIQQKILRHNGTHGLPGLSEERVAVFAGGLAILIAIFKTFLPQSIEASQSALREGVIHDLIGRKRDFDIRDQTVSNLCERFSVDKQQTSRVKNTALALFAQTFNDWQPTPNPSGGCSRGLRICTKLVWTSLTTPTINMAAICSPIWICPDSPEPSRLTWLPLSACIGASFIRLCWREIPIGL